MLPPKTAVFAAVAAALILAAPVAAAGSFVYLRGTVADQDVAHSELFPEYGTVLGGTGRAASGAGSPATVNGEGDVFLSTPVHTGRYDSAARVGAVVLNGALLHPVLPDGTMVPASAFPFTFAAGAGSLGERALAVDLPGAPSAKRAAPAGAFEGDTWTPPTLTSGSAVAPVVSSPLPGRLAGVLDVFGDPVETKPAAKPAGPASVRPAAVALAPAASNAPVVAAAVGAAALGLLVALWPLYHRLRGAQTLESDSRKKVYDAVCARPGAGVAEIAEKTTLSYSTATYHLDRLAEAGMVVGSSEGGRLRYYKNGGFNESDRRMVAVLENKEAMRLLALIRDNPGTYRAALADALNVTTTTVNWHLKSLLAAGLVREERVGRSAHLFPVPEKVDGEMAPLAQKIQATA